MDFKTTKHDLEEAFTLIVNQIEEGSLPDVATANRFSRLAGMMHQLSDETWMEEAEDFSHLAGQFLNAVKKHDLESCHAGGIPSGRPVVLSPDLPRIMLRPDCFT